MDFSYLSSLVLGLTLIALFLARKRSVAIEFACEVVLLVAVEAILLLRGSSPLPSHQLLTQDADGAWLRALAVVWWLIAARIVVVLTVLALGHDARSRQARLVSDLLAAGIYVTAALIILNAVLDLRVNGLIATSGVMAIVLGLALQNTLADVFSGIAVGLEKPFHIGDQITIRDHAEGKVVEMNWRAIRILTDGEDLATIPNSIVARNQIINRSVPSQRRAASVEIPTLSSDRAEHLMDLIRQAILLCPSILETPAPSVSIKSFGTRITTLGVSYRVATTPDLGRAKSELLRQVRRLFRHAGIQEGSGQPPSHEALLAGLVLFESLSPSQIAGLAAGLIERSLDPGERVFEQGSAGASLFIIRSGIFEIGRRAEEDVTIPLGRVGPGEYLGEISMMTGEPRSVHIEALTPGTVLELPRAALASLLGRDNELSVAIEKSVRRGMALLDRDDAARFCEPLDAGGALLKRVRAFLHLGG